MLQQKRFRIMGFTQYIGDRSSKAFMLSPDDKTSGIVVKQMGFRPDPANPWGPPGGPFFVEDGQGNTNAQILNREQTTATTNYYDTMLRNEEKKIDQEISTLQASRQALVSARDMIEKAIAEGTKKAFSNPYMA